VVHRIVKDSNPALWPPHSASTAQVYVFSSVKPGPSGVGVPVPRHITHRRCSNVSVFGLGQTRSRGVPENNLCHDTEMGVVHPFVNYGMLPDSSTVAEISVIHPAAASYVRPPLNKGGGMDEMQDRVKELKNAAISGASAFFVPLSHQSYERLGEKAMVFLRTLPDVGARRRWGRG
jgi:hypothetical protein